VPQIRRAVSLPGDG